MIIEIGAAFLVPSGPGTGKHLHCIISDIFDGKYRLFVSITSIYCNRHYDPACILSAADHPFLQHPSYVAYRHIEQRTEAHIQKMIGNGTYVAQEKFDEAVLRRIIEGAHQSDEIKPFAEKILSGRNA